MAKTEGFLTRWSRLKQQAPSSPDTVADTPPSPPEAAAPETAQIPAPELPPLETVGVQSDFSPFMRAEVAEDVRQSALKQLFADPHFNVMDGLDIHIEDYTQPDPLPAGMLERLAQAQIFLEKIPGEAASPKTLPETAQDVEKQGDNDKDANVQNVAPEGGQ